jgi:DNA-binding NarL/FixJ family response regulator
VTIRVALIDDHPVVRAGLRSLLRNEPDVEVVGEAANGLDGIALARQVRPDIVLTDVLMPDMDGGVVIRRIREEHPEIQVVVLTGVSEDDACVVQAVRAGAIGYVVKSADTWMLLRTIRSAAVGQIHLSPRTAARLMQEVRSPMNESVLTERQREVLREIAAGRTNKEIALRLQIALSTVKCHVRAIMDKLKVDSRTQAALRALRSELLETDVRAARAGSADGGTGNAACLSRVRDDLGPRPRPWLVSSHWRSPAH